AEEAWHEWYAALRTKGEWFEPGEDLMEWFEDKGSTEVLLATHWLESQSDDQLPLLESGRFLPELEEFSDGEFKEVN
ncbi:MAG: hypothetical protein ACYTF6_14620, partial [Planctomycetota bacterium]